MLVDCVKISMLISFLFIKPSHKTKQFVFLNLNYCILVNNNQKAICIWMVAAAGSRQGISIGAEVWLF
jgi:hypothetical protein